MRAWNRRRAALLVALALIIVLKARRLFGEERGKEPQILAEVSAQLAEEERFQNLAIEVDGRIVKLRGTVALLEDKRQALQKAQEVEDVRIVISHIKVATERIPDGSLLKELGQRMAEDQNGQVRLTVKKGVVTIQGTVQHEAQRERVLSIVASTPGVVGMKDRTQAAVH